MTSDLPPSYNSLYAPTNTVEEAVPRCESEDEAGLLAYEYCFEDKTTRIGFIQKVLGLKLLQMLFMTAIIAGFWANTVDIIRFMYRGNHLRDLMLVSNVVFILVYGMMVACGRIRRRSPYRYLFLVVHPLSLSVYISVWTIFRHLLAPVLLFCVYYCIVLFALLLYSIFALQTKLQFNTKYCILIAIGTQIVLYAVTISILKINSIINAIIFIVYILCPTIILKLEYIYVIYNIEAMTSTYYWNDITPADFIDGAINLHIDYYNIIYNLVLPKICHCSRIHDLSRVEEILDI